MAEQAQITSIEALESFRASLVIYLNQVRPVLEEAARGGIHTKLWLENDQHKSWQHELRKRYRQLEEARMELFNAKLSPFQDSSQLHQYAVQKAQRAVQEAEAKLQVIRNWERELENRTAPLVKQIEQLHSFLATDMARAVIYLTQIISTLTAYRNTGTPGNSDPGNPSFSGDNIEPVTDN
jgi:hypothetical protein